MVLNGVVAVVCVLLQCVGVIVLLWTRAFRICVCIKCVLIKGSDYIIIICIYMHNIHVSVHACMSVLELLYICGYKQAPIILGACLDNTMYLTCLDNFGRVYE